MEFDYLKKAIYEYLKNNKDKNVDSVDVCYHFKLRVDIICTLLNEMENENVIRRENYFGSNYRYIVL